MTLEADIEYVRNAIFLSGTQWGEEQGPLRAFERVINALPRWRPIDTAPKEGRQLILLLTPTRFPQVAYSNTWWTCGFSVENKPTHWIPLPKPPKGG